MRVVLVMAALTAAVMGSGVLWAQDEEPVRLQYKFVPGRTTNYEVKGDAAMPVTITVGQQGENQTLTMDLTMDLRLDIKETCEQVLENGDGKLLMALPLMIIQVSTAVANQAVEALVTWENNVLAVTVNGQTMPRDPNTESLVTLLSNPFKLTVTPTGAAKLDEETLQLLGEMVNNPLGGFSYSLNSLTGGLSEAAVKTGDTWEVTITGEQTHGTLEGAATCQLAGFEEIEGIRCARIEGEAQVRSLKPLPNLSVGGPGQGEITALDLQVTFVNYFDPEVGHMVLSTMDMTQDVSMVVTVGGQGGAQAMELPATIQDGQMHLEMRYKPAK